MDEAENTLGTYLIELFKLVADPVRNKEHNE